MWTLVLVFVINNAMPYVGAPATATIPGFHSLKSCDGEIKRINAGLPQALLTAVCVEVPKENTLDQMKETWHRWKN